MEVYIIRFPMKPHLIKMEAEKSKNIKQRNRPKLRKTDKNTFLVLICIKSFNGLVHASLLKF